MKRMSQAEFDDLAMGAAVLSADEHGPKVLLRSDDRVIKLFRRKRRWSSAMCFPYARRFATASRELTRRGIAAAEVQRCARVPSIRRDLVIYRRLEGVTLREALAAEVHDREPLLLRLAELLARLHECGVYFRAAHFGNILACPTESGDIGLSLIDLSETRFRSHPLSPAMRARNFRPLTRYPEDLAAIESFGTTRLVQHYLDVAKLAPKHQARFLAALHGIHEALADA